MEVKTLIEVEKETRRFLSRLAAAKARLTKDIAYTYAGTKETGALKRAALDLKNELTRITQG